MELLNDLMGILEKAPELAIWIFLILFGFQTIVVGSIYAVSRFVVDRIALTIERRATDMRLAAEASERAQNTPRIEHVRIFDDKDLNGVLISASKSDVVAFLRSIRGEGMSYTHPSDLRFAEQAVAEKKEREKVKS